MSKGFGKSQPSRCDFDGIVWSWNRGWTSPEHPVRVIFKRRHLASVQAELPDLRRYFPWARFELISEQGKPLLKITSPNPPLWPGNSK